MKTPPRPASRALTFVVAILSVLFGPLAAGTAGADDQIITRAEAFVDIDGARDMDTVFEVHDLDSPVVDAGNLAFAHALRCTDCQAVALSFQIVLLQQPVTTLVPENLAVSLNEECTGCDAAAGAYQFIVGRGEPVRLTPTGYQQLGQIRGEVHRLQGSRLSGPETVAAADSLADRIRAILAAEVQPVADGYPPHIEDHRYRAVGNSPVEESSTVVAAA